MFDKVLNTSLQVIQRRIQNPVEHLQWSFFVKIVFSQKNSIVYVRLDSKYASGLRITANLLKDWRIQNPVKHLRWSFLQKQLVAFSRLLLSQKALFQLGVSLGSKCASENFLFFRGKTLNTPRTSLNTLSGKKIQIFAAIINWLRQVQVNSCLI